MLYRPNSPDFSPHHRVPPKHSSPELHSTEAKRMFIIFFIYAIVSVALSAWTLKTLLNVAKPGNSLSGGSCCLPASCNVLRLTKNDIISTSNFMMLSNNTFPSFSSYSRLCFPTTEEATKMGCSAQIDALKKSNDVKKESCKVVVTSSSSSSHHQIWSCKDFDGGDPLMLAKVHAFLGFGVALVALVVPCVMYCCCLKRLYAELEQQQLREGSSSHGDGSGGFISAFLERVDREDKMKSRMDLLVAVVMAGCGVVILIIGIVSIVMLEQPVEISSAGGGKTQDDDDLLSFRDCNDDSSATRTLMDGTRAVQVNFFLAHSRVFVTQLVFTLVVGGLPVLGFLVHVLRLMYVDCCKSSSFLAAGRRNGGGHDDDGSSTSGQKMTDIQTYLAVVVSQYSAAPAVSDEK